jgi:eukaryotic-like serine/threonine-protein kinase
MAQFRHQFVLLTYLFAVLLFTSNVQAGMDTTATWTFQTGGAVYSSPTCDNSSVYIGSDDNNLYCLDAVSGSMQWKYKTGGIIRCKPAIADTVVFFESDDGYLYAVNNISGIKIWSVQIGNNTKRILPDPSTFSGNYWDYMQSSPCVDSGIVYAGSGDSSFYAVHAQTGILKWKTKTGGIIRSSPCVYQGIVYVGSWDGYIYAFNKADGTVIWKYNTQANGYQNVQPSPRISNGIVYCGSRSGYFYALDAINGTLIWKYSYDPNAPWVESSAAVVNGVVYVGSSDMNRVFAFDDSTGKVVWNGIVQGDTWSTPFYYHGTLYIGLAHYSNAGNGSALYGGALLAMDASTGKTKWQYKCGATSFIGGVVSSPLAAGHTIYYGSLDGKVYAVDTAFGQQTTGIKKSGDSPKIFQLHHNYPNPFNPTTTIAYQVSVASRVTLKVYDSLGREVRTLVDEVKEPGGYKVKFDAGSLSSGVYFNNLTSGLFRETKAMVLLK